MAAVTPCTRLPRPPSFANTLVGRDLSYPKTERRFLKKCARVRAVGAPVLRPSWRELRAVSVMTSRVGFNASSARLPRFPNWLVSNPGFWPLGCDASPVWLTCLVTARFKKQLASERLCGRLLHACCRLPAVEERVRAVDQRSLWVGQRFSAVDHKETIHTTVSRPRHKVMPTTRYHLVAKLQGLTNPLSHRVFG